MHLFPKVVVLALIVIVVLYSLVFGWTTPRQIGSENFAEVRAATASRRIYAIMYMTGYDLSFISSLNNGYSWNNPVEPTDTFYGSSESPDIKCTPNGLIHIVWAGGYQDDLNHVYMFHQSSSDGGRHWTNRHKIFNSSARYGVYPRLANKGDTLFVAFGMDSDLMVFRSFNSGLSWRDSSAADTGISICYPPTILHSQDRLHLVYEFGTSEVGYEVYYSYSDDLGLTWTRRIPLSTIGPPYFASQEPCAFADQNGHLAVFWFDYKYGSMCGVTGDILGKISTDNGESWLPETRLSFTQSGSDPNCLILGDSIFVVWADSDPLGCAHPKIEIASSGDWGTSWSEPEVIGNFAPVTEQFPFLSSSRDAGKDVIHCLFRIYNPPDGTGIFYIRNRSFYSDRMPMPDPQPVFLSIKAYPSIFNSSTMISVDNEDGGEVDLEIYNVLGQRIWHNSMDGKEGTIIWDAKDMDGNGISSGTYFLKATDGGNTKTMKLIYLK